MNPTKSVSSIDKLRKEFKLYLKETHPEWSSSTVDMHYSDSFFAYNNMIGDNFWCYLSSEEGISKARDNIYDFLETNNKPGDPNQRANGYKTSLQYFKDFLDLKYPTLAKEWSEDTSLEPSAWMFQCNPKHYDIVNALNDLDKITWTVNRYKSEIKKGDKAYIWLSGSDGGIVAKGIIMCNPEMIEFDDDPYNIGDSRDKGPHLAVDIKIEKNLISSIITRKALLDDERTKKLLILRQPAGTNFSVTREEETVIESMIDGTYRKVVPIKPVDRKYWIFAPGESSSMWEEFYSEGIMGIGWDELGDLSNYPSKDAMKQEMKKLYGEEYSYKNAGHATWQFANEIKPGDIVFAKKGLKKIIGRGVVTSDYIYDSSRDSYQHIHEVNWTHKGEWDHEGQLVLKTLTNITPYTDYCRKLEDLFENVIDIDPDDVKADYEKYSEKDFLDEVFMSKEKYLTLKNLLKKKKNIILQGAPGVGKTYAAERLAYSIMGEKDKSRVMVVQFHQSYSYEDFIMGYRPSDNGFTLAKGPFYEFCKEAEPDDREYFFIIDEINRGNLSKIFGELLMLIENDKRGKGIRLLYTNEQFSVPENVYIIGMMNTADRSLAMIDYALRRRFAFFEFEPAFDSEGFKKYQNKINNLKLDKLISRVILLNEEISDDPSLGSGFRIGHSYFLSDDVNDEWLSDVVEYELIPLINEYWFDEPSKVRQWAEDLRGAING